MQTNQGDAVRSRKWLAAIAAGALTLGIAACGGNDSASTTSTGGGKTTSSASASLNGAGSTFAAPIYQDLASKLKGDGVTVNYQGVGSGAGIEQFTAGTVNFAGSDPPMTDEEMAAVKGSQPVHVPVALGAITVSYNLSGVDTGLKLDGKTIADLFLGKITKWDDPAIKALNPGVDLPSTDVTVVHRSDSSGTTKGFTGFLAAVSPQWKSKVGSDKDVKWPTGTGAKGNDGVAAAVKQTDGGVGYVEQAYALQNNFTFASVKNKSGKFVVPTLASTTAAADGLKLPADLRFAIDNPANPAAYPIASQTFVIVHKDLCKGGLSADQAKGVKTFLDYTLGTGQDEIKNLSYAPLPSSIQSKSQAAVAGLQCNGSPVGS
jgi:phosphate transport system substrate-binding protein